jgi:hypothetical protein
MESGVKPLAYVAYDEGTTYRWSFICEKCYATLDNHDGVNAIDSRSFNLAGKSRQGKAASVDRIKYRKFLHAEAARLGRLLADWFRWRDGTVIRIAEKIKARCAFEDLPVLADALEDAGCTDHATLAYFRYVGQHFRACWPLDLLLFETRTIRLDQACKAGK